MVGLLASTQDIGVTPSLRDVTKRICCAAAKAATRPTYIWPSSTRYDPLACASDLGW